MIIGFAYDKVGNMYFIDGNRIRLIDVNGKVRTIIENYNFDTQIYKPFVCNKTYSFDSIRFYWPTSLAINPLDNTVYVLDENVIYKITQDERVDVIAGIPQGCNLDLINNNDFWIKLKNPIDMDFNTEGDLFILENDRNKIKQIKVIKSTGEVDVYFGTGIDS